MSMYRTPIVTGDRVALAPHTDQWMMGLRFGKVDDIYITDEGFLRYLIVFDSEHTAVVGHDDLMGAVAGTPVGGDARPSIPLSEAVTEDMTVYADEFEAHHDDDPQTEYADRAADRDMRAALQGWGQ